MLNFMVPKRRDIACLLALYAILPTTVSAQPEEQIRIGVSTPLSGDAATYGIDVKNILEFASETIGHGKYRLIFEDDRCEAKQAASIANKFASVDGLHYVLGVVCTDALSASAPIYSRAKIEVITPTANLDDIQTAGVNVFTTIPSDTEAMKPLAEYVCPRHSRIGVLAELTEMSQQMAGKFEAQCKSTGSDVIRIDFQAKDLDFRAVLLRLQQSNIDAIFIDTQTEASFLPILKQLNESNQKVTIYGALFPGTSEFLEKAGPLAEGIRFVDLPNVSDAVNPSGQHIFDDYVKRFGKMKSIEFLFVTTFESFRVLDLAIQSGKPLRDYLKTSTFEGLTGPYKFGSNGVITGIRHSMKIIKNGKVEPLVN